MTRRELARAFPRGTWVTGNDLMRRTFPRSYHGPWRVVGYTTTDPASLRLLRPGNRPSSVGYWSARYVRPLSPDEAAPDEAAPHAAPADPRGLDGEGI